METECRLTGSLGQGYREQYSRMYVWMEVHYMLTLGYRPRFERHWKLRLRLWTAEE